MSVLVKKTNDSRKAKEKTDMFLFGRREIGKFKGLGYRKLIQDPPMSRREVKSVASAINHPLIKDILKENPLEELRIENRKGNIFKGTCHSILWQDPNTNTQELLTSKITINQNIKERQDYRTGKTIEDYPHTFSQTKNSKLEALRATVHHEVGHHLYYLSSKVQQIVKEKWDTHMVELTEYQAENIKEYFSESLAMYLDDPAKFKNLDNHGADMINSCLAVLREGLKQ
jgi:hypothetical protein